MVKIIIINITYWLKIYVPAKRDSKRLFDTSVEPLDLKYASFIYIYSTDIKRRVSVACGSCLSWSPIVVVCLDRLSPSPFTIIFRDRLSLSPVSVSYLAPAFLNGTCMYFNNTTVSTSEIAKYRVIVVILFMKFSTHLLRRRKKTTYSLTVHWTTNVLFTLFHLCLSTTVKTPSV